MTSNTFDLSKIDAIIFDLGKVIIGLEMDDTYNAFRQLFKEDYEAALANLNAKGHFELYETGQMSTEAFLAGIIEESGVDNEQAIIDAWNAMLKDLPNQNLKILEEAKKIKRTFCLSNTNVLHIDFVYAYLQREKNIPNLDEYFETVYLSHEVEMRKPNAEIFEFVLNENSLDASRTLFIDDTLEHIEGARKVGLQTHHLLPGQKLEDLFIV